MSTPPPAPLAPYAFVVPADWCDYNQHFSDGHYLVAFSAASERALEAVGLGAGYRAQGHFSAYTVESRVRYLREAKAGQTLQIVQRVVRHDAKRMWLEQEMRRDAERVATCEVVYLHVDTSVPRAAPFPPAVLAAISARCAADTGAAACAGEPAP